MVALGGGVFLFGAAVLRLETRLTGVAGVFVVGQCEVSESRGDDEWKCGGSFRANDDSFLLPEVEVDTTFATKPTGPVPALVDDESSTTAVVRDNGVWLYPGATGLLCLVVGGWNVRSALRGTKEEPTAPVPA
ncbi:hypothetical protein JIX56_02215 [Streptomyces sp. CA-210063]|uniref:hypothetical protein n=1 Tax=Streptomyces sp. CA-210063 TaxID=2801029 RepID=UPI00214C9678|nr:hypothetical protein [Streptomyces sp. CA-210063]UUU36856.1 hypothetical protein JIX56_02215 [Streptomyces sp. CA-210063]